MNLIFLKLCFIPFVVLHSFAITERIYVKTRQSCRKEIKQSRSRSRTSLVTVQASASDDPTQSLNAIDLCLCGALASIVGNDVMIVSSRYRLLKQSKCHKFITPCTGDFVMHPVDTIKITQQASSSAITVMTAAQKILRQGGPAAFYQGVVPYLIADGISGSIKFAAFEMSRRFVESKLPEKYHPFTKFLCAAGAYVASSVALVPGEVLKTGLQAGVASTLIGLVKKTFAEEGVGGFFVGYGATLLRDVPYTMLELGLYENFKTMIRRLRGRSTLTQNEELAAAAVTGGFTSFVTTPLDVIKTKLMTQTLEGAVQYSSIGDAFGSIWAKEGLHGLFAGSLARVVWLLPFTTIYLGVYEVAKRRLAAYKQTKTSQH